jgi:hypothetical protein
VAILAALPGGHPVATDILASCPFLGLRGDRLTRCDFPDPLNLCHAAAASGAARSLRWRSHTGGAGRPVEVSLEHQRTVCLTTAHGQCPRYPVAAATLPGR